MPKISGMLLFGMKKSMLCLASCAVLGLRDFKSCWHVKAMKLERECVSLVDPRLSLYPIASRHKADVSHTTVYYLTECSAMSVRRIVTDISHPRPAEAKAFYQDILGLKVVMDQGWIITFQSDCDTHPQISIGSEGGSGTAMPDVSIEVDDVNLIYSRCKDAGCMIKYDLTQEPWGVKRFFVLDPAGKTVNVLAHT